MQYGNALIALEVRKYRGGSCMGVLWRVVRDRFLVRSSGCGGGRLSCVILSLSGIEYERGKN